MKNSAEIYFTVSHQTWVKNTFQGEKDVIIFSYGTVRVHFNIFIAASRFL